MMDNIQGQNAQPGGAAPVWYARPEVRRLLVVHDIGGVYRVVCSQQGWSQREIARRTGQSQSEVCEILRGRRRRVENVQLLRRIVGGLEIPPERMGLSWWGPDGRYYGPTGSAGADPRAVVPARAVVPGQAGAAGVEDEVRRRHVIALGAVCGFGVQVPGVGALTEPYPRPARVEVPSRVGMSHVSWVRETAERLVDLRRTYGGHAEVASGEAAEFTRWLTADGPEPVKRALAQAVARAHQVAGLCCFDSGLNQHARDHYRQALELAIMTQDHLRAASVLRFSGELEAMAGDPDTALKCYQFGHATLLRARGDDPRTVQLASRLHASSGQAYARLGDQDQALACQRRARDRWEPPDAFERADFDWVTAVTAWRLGRLDEAEPFAAAAAQGFAERERRDWVKARITWATIQVQSGEPGGLVLAHQVMADVAPLRSVPTRQRLLPLADALSLRPESEAGDLARTAHQLATTRP